MLTTSVVLHVGSNPRIATDLHNQTYKPDLAPVKNTL